MTMTNIFPSIAKNFLLSLWNMFYHSTSDLCNLWFVLCHFSFAISQVLYKWVYTTYIILPQASFTCYIYIFFFEKKFFFILLVYQQCVTFFYCWVAFQFIDLFESIYLFICRCTFSLFWVFWMLCVKLLSPFNTTFCVTHIFYSTGSFAKWQIVSPEWFEYISKLHKVESLKTEWQSHTFKLD